MRKMKNLFKARWMTSLIFLIALFVITGIAAPGFLTYDNIVTCFNTATMYTLLAVGIAFVIMTGEIDVSIGATLGLTAGMTGLIAQQDGSILKMLLLCLATGAAIGLVNGVGVSYFGVPSLIFTLGTNSVVRGLIYIMSGGRTIENFGGAISSYGNTTVFAGVTLYYAIAVVLVAISHLALTKTRKGKYFIALHVLELQRIHGLFVFTKRFELVEGHCLFRHVNLKVIPHIRTVRRAADGLVVHLICVSIPVNKLLHFLFPLI